MGLGCPGLGWVLGTCAHCSPRFCTGPLSGIKCTLTGTGSQSPVQGASRGLSCGLEPPWQQEGMFHSSPAQRFTCAPGAFIPAQLRDGLSLTLHPSQ